MEKRMTIEVTIVIAEGDLRFEFYEPESGDFMSYAGERATVENLGNELMSWVSLMEEELEENEEEED